MIGVIGMHEPLIAGMDLDAGAREDIAHGWIQWAILTGHAVAGLAGEHGEAGHERPANAQDVDMTHSPAAMRTKALPPKI
ncbi:hypothetical protein BBH56_07915 [Spiribacter roseus]|nr:hypothetical protein BBH56_07915 [Spiribacter roseus]